jgi:hypothetical protein
MLLGKVDHYILPLALQRWYAMLILGSLYYCFVLNDQTHALN